MTTNNHSIQSTSIQSYADIKPELSERQAEVYETIGHKALNNTMIARKLGKPINSITPRTHELRELDLVTEAFKAICPHTKRKTIFWKQNTLTKSRNNSPLHKVTGEKFCEESVKGNDTAGVTPESAPRRNSLSKGETP